MDDAIRIGDEVICVDDTIKPEAFNMVCFRFKIWIKKDKKYIVRDIFENDGIVTGILLEGISNPTVFIPLLKRMQEPAFAIWRFVKLRSAYMIQEEKESESVEEIEIMTNLN